MTDWRDIIAHGRCRYLDHTGKNNFHHKPYTALTSFAVDDVLALVTGSKDNTPALRLWAHPDTVVLGIPDTRLPYLEDGMNLLARHNYQTVVRNSGGLAVPLDEGVLNISLVLPDARDMSIYECYDAMVGFIRSIMADLTDEIEAYEIADSYCPGDYDLSIDGRKFAGISQRRVKGGAAIQIYMDVAGASRERAQLIRDFYDAALKGEETTFDYPDVNPDVMASLSELLGMRLTVEEVKQRVLNTLQEESTTIMTDDFSEEELKQFEKRYQQMVKRNDKVAGMQSGRD